ncbi:hypothetical protein [Winogradskyella thalassocola]|uniref:SGNH/GDSL hydrolase family protein n=1 Tax=Winogradskyella thalassocola TaxID=262004 RepID=A0A1G8DK19_9FLAO|nr:hypothetical protein [Winogradskyella thalassocola]SDH58004.1 hypothetical protein SAMN04489796_103236 [Winogradskyella thalassocola]
MKKFFNNIILFGLVALCIGEIVVRLTHVNSDIPYRTIDDMGIQKYYPNQEGYWKGGDHKWMVNSLGWPGELPDNYDNLITIIGDSFIENFMNPNDCHQSAYLKREIPNYNFLEASRSGVTLIESMEISKQTDTLNPIATLIHTGNGDIYESIKEIKSLNDITQLNTKDEVIIHGKMKSPGLKKVLYSWKLLYYLYNRFPLNFKNESIADSKKDKTEKSKFEINETRIRVLLNYIKNNYKIENKIFVFKPNSDDNIINLFKSMGFKTIILDSSKDKSWSFEHDPHWTCYGHERAAAQVSNKLKLSFLNRITVD